MEKSQELKLRKLIREELKRTRLNENEEQDWKNQLISELKKLPWIVGVGASEDYEYLVLVIYDKYLNSYTGKKITNSNKLSRLVLGDNISFWIQNPYAHATIDLQSKDMTITTPDGDGSTIITKPISDNIQKTIDVLKTETQRQSTKLKQTQTRNKQSLINHIKDYNRTEDLSGLAVSISDYSGGDEEMVDNIEDWLELNMTDKKLPVTSVFIDKLYKQIQYWAQEAGEFIMN